jgi:hypothetical protein
MVSASQLSDDDLTAAILHSHKTYKETCRRVLALRAEVDRRGLAVPRRSALDVGESSGHSPDFDMWRNGVPQPMPAFWLLQRELSARQEK